MKGQDKLKKHPWLKTAWTPSSAHQLKSRFSSFCPLASKSTLSGTTSSLGLPCLPPPHCFAVWVSSLSVHSHSSPASLTHPENTFPSHPCNINRLQPSLSRQHCRGLATSRLDFFPQLPSSFASSLCEPPNSYNHQTLLRSTSPLSCRSFAASHLISV